MGGMSNVIKSEQYKQDIKCALERLRGAIRIKVHPREQAHFLDVVDRIQEFVLKEAGELEQIQGQIARTKDSTRRMLRQKPVDMVQLLNELDGIERDVVEFFSSVSKGENPAAPPG
jgi:hypothetical protein